MRGKEAGPALSAAGLVEAGWVGKPRRKAPQAARERQSPHPPETARAAPPGKVEGMKPKPAGGEAEQVKRLSALLEPRAAQGLGLTD